MCKMFVAIRRECLGNRETGWSLWTGKDVMETTARNIKDMLKSGTYVAGLKLGGDGELELDSDGFYTTNLIEHRAAGNYKPMITGDMMANVMYTVIGLHQEKGVDMCDCVSSKFEQISLTADEVKSYIKLGLICSGARIDGENIVIADVNPAQPNAVESEARADEEIIEQGAVTDDVILETEEKTPGRKPGGRKTGSGDRKKS